MLGRIKSKLGYSSLAALGLLLLAALAGVVNSGPLDPPGTPGSTDATVINSLPYTVTSPGLYVLKKNLTGAAGSNGITVSADNVTIDLNGFALIGPGGTGFEEGITDPGFIIRNLAVRNGTVRDWPCKGIEGSASGGVYSDLRVSGNGHGTGGICITVGGGLIVGEAGVATNIAAVQNRTGIRTASIGAVRQCSATQNDTGIVASYSTVEGCSVSNNRDFGIAATYSVITGNSIIGNGTSGISGAASLRLDTGNVAINNTIAGSSRDGIAVIGSGNRVIGNGVTFTTTPGFTAIYVGGSRNRIEDNAVVSAYNGIYMTGNNNLIVKNSVSDTSAFALFFGGTDNVWGPVVGIIGFPASPTPLDGAWANIKH